MTVLCPFIQVCSPTRATVLTGRNHFRDCVDYVYGCSDMTECVPHFNFAPQHTYTAPMAVRDAGKGYSSWFGGKWHLGSFYNDSEKLGGITSSPISHGTALSGSISTVLTVFSWICVGIHRCGALLSPVCA